MKVILNIDDELLRDMKKQAEIVQEDLDVMLSNMFAKYVGLPAKVISEEVKRDDCKEFEDFHLMMINFLTMTAHDPNNTSMQKILIRLREHTQDMHIMTDLYKTYKTTHPSL